MALGFDGYDASSHVADPTASITPVGTIRAVVAYLLIDGGTAETCNLDYGGTPMTELTEADGSGNSEPHRVKAYFLGSSIPTGNQTVTADCSGTQLKFLAVYTYTADADCEVDDQDQLVSSSLDDPSLTLTASAEAWATAGIKSGLGNSSNVTAGTGYTKDLDLSTGGDSAETMHANAAASAGSVTVNWVTSAADDVAFKAVLVKESAGVPDLSVSESESITMSESVGRMLESGVKVQPGIQEVPAINIEIT